MRLRGCILVEVAALACLVSGVALVGGVSAGLFTGAQAWGQGQALAAVPVRIASSLAPEGKTWASTARAADHRPLERPPPVDRLAAQFGVFNGVRDDYLIEPLRHRPAARVKFNRGGSSISLRVDFEGGGRGAFKPDQTNLQTIPRKEVAAFRLNRLLGLSCVPPALAREFSRDELMAHLDPESAPFQKRLMEEMVVDELGTVRGQVTWWITGLSDATLGGYLMDSVDGMWLWKRYLKVGAEAPEAESHKLAQLSSVIAFDFLTNNVDRWSGSNVKGSADGRYLYCMDNTLAFGPQVDGHLKVQVYLQRVQKFSRSLYKRLRTLDEEEVRWVVGTDTGPYDELLTDDEIVAMMARRDALVLYIDGLIAQHGEAQILVFP